MLQTLENKILTALKSDIYKKMIKYEDFLREFIIISELN